jgi:hypothetical protein
MSKYLPATLGIVVMLMASPTLSNDVSVPSGKVAEGLQTPSLSEELKLEMLIRDLDNFNRRTAQWGRNPMEAAMKGEVSTVGGPAREGDAIDFAALSREGLSRLPLADPRAKIFEMFSIETVGLPVPLLSPF